MTELRIECKLDFKRYVKLLYYLIYQKFTTVLITVIGLSMLVSSSMYFMGAFNYFDQPPYAQILLGLIFSFVIPASVYKQAKRNFNSIARLSEFITYLFTPEMIYINGESFKTEMTWDKFYKIKELKNWILIYTNKNNAHVIPKDSFSESQLIRFREIAGNLKTVKVQIKK